MTLQNVNKGFRWPPRCIAGNAKALSMTLEMPSLQTIALIGVGVSMATPGPRGGPSQVQS